MSDEKDRVNNENEFDINITKEKLQDRLPEGMEVDELLDEIKDDTAKNFRGKSWIEKDEAISKSHDSLISRGIDEESIQDLYLYYVQKKIEELASKVVRNNLGEGDFTSLKYTSKFSDESKEEKSKYKSKTIYNYYSPECILNEKSKTDKLSVGSNLSKILDDKGMTRTKLAEIVGLSRATIVSLLKDGNSISLLNAYKIAEVLNVDIKEVFPLTSNTDSEENSDK